MMPNSPAADHWPKVAICVATYRRPKGIRALLRSLDALVFRDVSPDIRVIVVDNAPDAPAFEGNSQAQEHCRWPLIYRHEATQGIVFARNHCLQACPADADYIAFLDDDETVTPQWLAAHLTTIQSTGAAAVQGPVMPVYEMPPPEWVKDLHIFTLGPFEEGEQLNFAATNNVLIDAAFLREHDLRFDERFNQTGGEDEELFGRLRERGGRIHAASKALVMDDVPANRMTLRWVLTRWRRMGNTLGRIAIYRKDGRFKRVLKGLGAIMIGVSQTIVTAPFRKDLSIAGLMLAARGVGMLQAFGNATIVEYSVDRLRRDRVGGR